MLHFEILYYILRFNQHINLVKGRVIKKLKISESFKKLARTKIFIWNSIKLTCLGMLHNRYLLLYTLNIPCLESKEKFFMKVTHITPIFLHRFKLTMNHPFFPIRWAAYHNPEPITYNERVDAILEYDTKIENAFFCVTPHNTTLNQNTTPNIHELLLNELAF